MGHAGFARRSRSEAKRRTPAATRGLKNKGTLDFSRVPLVGHAGFEPATTRLKVGCSTAELMTRARPEGFEPPTYGSEGRHSIQLS